MDILEKPFPVVTMNEVRRQFDQEYVLLDKPETSTATGEVESGVLLWHSPDKAEVWAKAKSLPKPMYIAFFFVGNPPVDRFYLL